MPEEQIQQQAATPEPQSTRDIVAAAARELPGYEPEPENANPDDSGDSDVVIDDNTDHTNENTEVIDEHEPVVEKPVVEEKKLTPEEQEKADLLKSLGADDEVKAGKKDNYIPQTRVKVMASKAYEKGVEVGRKFGAEAVEKLSASEKRVQQLETERALLDQDPDKAIEVLAHFDDRYKKFLQPAQQREETPAFDETKDPKPQPDIKYQDGTVGYSPEQWDKKEAWSERRLEAKLEAKHKKALEQELTPIKAREDAIRQEQANEQYIKTEFGAAVQVWGKELVDKYDKPIAKAVSDPKYGKMDIRDIVSMVISAELKKGQTINQTAVETAARERLLKEQAERARGAVASPGGHHQAAPVNPNPSTRDIVAAAARKLAGRA